ncbi:prepro-urotensin II-beta-like [Xiphias gladius]|uniref:prepro-urotensin II-beta-like n=1 Tax=Xiphias gladius TaxID=8245 RepID=UPI001A99C701|nr:prepro-urotensin II-beta-like [Xiphias gladius]
MRWGGAGYSWKYITQLEPTEHVQGFFPSEDLRKNQSQFQEQCPTVMKCKNLLSWAFLLVASGPLLAHPITESAEMPYPGPVSIEDRGVGALDDLSLSEQTFPPQGGAGLRYSTLISGETNRDGVRTTGLLPRGMKREVLLEKQSLLNPFSHVFGIRKQFRKREGNSECFWKYCV